LRTSCAFSILVWFSKFQTVNPGCPPSQSHTFVARLLFDETFANPAGCFCSSEQPCRSVECVLLHLLMRHLIFLQLWTALTWHWVRSTPVLTRCRIFLQLWSTLS